MITLSELSLISEWLKKLNVEFYQCDSCLALHLSYLQKLDGVADAKVELIDNVVMMSVIADIKSSAIMSLMAELSQINLSTFFAKVYLDVKDNSEARIVFSYSLHMTDGLTFNQFSMSLASLEEEALQVIGELHSCDLLSNKHHSSDELHSSVFHTFH